MAGTGTGSFGDPSWSWIKRKLPALQQQKPRLGSLEKEPSLERVSVIGNVAIYTSDYEPYPFELDMVVVEAVYFSMGRNV